MSNKTTDYVVGLDIGTTKIAVLIGRKNEHGKLEILGMGKAPSPGVSRGVVTRVTPTVEAIKEAVRQAEEKSELTVREVNVGIAGQHIRSIQHRGVKIRDSYEDEITEKDVEALRRDMYKLVMQPGEKIIEVIPQEYIVDNEQGIVDPVGMSGGRLEANFHLIIAQVAAVKNIVKCVEKAGLKPLEITLEPLASAEAVLHEDEKEAGVALVDIGGGTTDLAIFQENIIRHSAVIPFGGNVISEDIKEGCSIIRKQAELLKLKFGSTLASENLENEIISIPGLRGRTPKEISVKNLAHIIEARMTEIIEQVYYEIRNSGFEHKLIAGIVVTGGGSQLKHVTQLFEFTAGMDARIGYPAEHLAAGTEEITSPTFSTGVGLVLKGYDFLEYQERLENAGKKQEEKIIEPQLVTSLENNESPLEMEGELEDENLNFEERHIDRRGSLLSRFLERAKIYLEGDE
ncbi:MAG: cell division protein FtsA [Flavobacteriales bacterium]|jgi:cell division protein FtsA|tara:strand:+ start:153 stop:1529 length:1377 start_codon:yes stop_codon:yes gene_type:complete